MARVCIIGLDGGTFRIVDYLVAKNRLPNFAQALSTGSRAILKSTVPPLTPAAWAAFYTGTNPGKNSTIDFFKRQPGTYKLTPVNAATVGGQPLWTLAGNQAKRVCVYNVPVTYPAVPVNGIIISGMDAPRFDERSIYPAEYRKALLKAIPGFEIQPPIDAEYLVKHSPDPVGACIRQFESYLRMELDAVKHLLSLEPWDLFVGIIRATDRFQHTFWRSVEKMISVGENGLSTAEMREVEAVFSCYETIDGELAEIRSAMGPDCNLVIMSDHGFGELQKEVCVNRILEQAGLLKFLDSTERSANTGYLGRLSRALPEKSRRRLKRYLGRDYSRRRWSILADAVVADIDWGKTRIFSLGQFGCMFTNLKGRDPLGIVAGEQERTAVTAEAEAVLSEFVDPTDNEPIFTEFYRKEELFHGPEMADMPDLVTVMRDYAYRGVPSTGQELAELGIVRVPCPAWKILAHTGNHRREGMLLMTGPDISHANLGEAAMVDIAPTVANLMNISPLIDWDGDILEAGFRAGKAQPAVQGGITIPSGQVPAPLKGEPVYSEEDEDEVRKNLEDLGYL